ncbi:phosphoesterase [Candidatus Poribacteria bacterium]|nr:phosphoesterase [Candidatus Poribacteria bacterium]
MAELLTNPYAAEGEWLRGNLHTHTTLSDGSRDAAAVIADYEERGYGFLAISDHDRLLDPQPHVADRSLVLIPGVEVSARGPHILHIGASALLEPDPDRQVVVDGIKAQGAIAILNHPNWGRTFNHFPHELMESLTGYDGIEVYNGVIERLEGTSLATDRWDRLLSAGRQVWGYGNDDAHLPCDVELAWTVVRVSERSPGAVLDALRTGNCYASTGVVVRDIAVADSLLRIDTENAERIRFIGKHGVFLQTSEGRSATFALPTTPEDAQRLSYVRAECYGSGGRVAWTQPFICCV